MHGLHIGSAGRISLDMLWLELTTRCNLHCKHCYASAGVGRPLEGAMTLDGWLAIIDEALALGASAFQLIGGEPTLHPHFRTLLDRLAAAKPRLLEVYTNATRLTDDLVGCLKASGARVAASFYAAEPEVHDAVTMRAGSWQRTVAGLERALAAELPVRIGVIATAENRGRLEPAIAFLKRMGVRDVGVDRERGVGRGRTTDVAVAGAAGEDLTQLCGQCGRSRLCVASTGLIYPCVFARRSQLGHVRRGLAAALASPALAGFCSAMNLELRSRRHADRGAGGFCEPGPDDPNDPDGICKPGKPGEPQPDVDGPWRHARAHAEPAPVQAGAL